VTIWPLICALLYGCGNGSDSDPRNAVPLVETALASPAAPAEGSLTGVVASRIESDLGFRVGGKIDRRLVDAGQRVRRGDALMQLDMADLSLELAQQRELARAAAARLDLARRDEGRMRPIAEAGFASRRQYDATRTALDAARAEYAAARAQSDTAGNAARYGTLHADADGVIAAVLAEPGQVVAAGQPVLRLARDGAREAVVSIPEAMRPQLAPAATVTIYGMPGSTPARLRQLSAQADPATRTFEARYVLSGAAQAAPLGATLTVQPETGGRFGSPVLSVPIGAIYDPGDGPGVWVVAGREPSVRFRHVHVAQLREETALLDAGLRTGERVVALGAHLLHEGERVRIRR
jgi:RND family efflux transporter MFP subunit